MRDKIKAKLNSKLTEKKQYEVCIYKEGLFNVGVITALGLLSEDNRELYVVTDSYAGLILNMDIEQKTAIELALRDFIVTIKCNDEEPESILAKTVVIRR